jgi:hypothetical protein
MSPALRTRFQRPCFQQNNHCNAGTMGDSYDGMLKEFTYLIATRCSLIRELTFHRKLLTIHHHLWQEPRKHQLPRGMGGAWMQERFTPSKGTVAATQQAVSYGISQPYNSADPTTTRGGYSQSGSRMVARSGLRGSADSAGGKTSAAPHSGNSAPSHTLPI